MSEWISVKDKLPEENGKYLCVVVHRGGNVAIQSQCVYEFIANAEDDSDLFYKGVTGPVWAYYDVMMGMCATARVTHWMPLPELPED